MLSENIPNTRAVFQTYTTLIDGHHYIFSLEIHATRCGDILFSHPHYSYLPCPSPQNRRHLPASIQCTLLGFVTGRYFKFETDAFFDEVFFNSYN